MKQIILIGDSIRIGYQAVVRRELAGLAEIWTPKENGRDSRNVLAHLNDWVIARAPDLVHLNCGLHDLKTEFGATTHQVPLDEYAANVRVILTRVQRETRAQIIWATTTPVNEAWHHANKEFDRWEADVSAYNFRATQIARELNIPIDDLNAVVTQFGRDKILLPDGVHFSDEGYVLLGKRVAQAIKEILI
ncbi:MAG: GDSL-type esterase/lipase family protein [Anaerolineales bacterium]|nr:GDSL-type esterase/lipase family protein [Anaerolineales bacterium]